MLLLVPEYTCVVAVVDIRGLWHLQTLHSNPAPNMKDLDDGPPAVRRASYFPKLLVSDALRVYSAEVDYCSWDRDVLPAVAAQTADQTRGQDR